MDFKNTALFTIIAIIGWLWYTGELGGVMDQLFSLGEVVGGRSGAQGR